MNRQQLIEIVLERKSMICVGLDSEISKIPAFICEEFKEDPVFEFNKRIIDATIDYAVAYKPNLAFYESRGVAGWNSLLKTMDYLSSLSKKAFTIADAKRADIGNTSLQYAKAFFDKTAGGFDFDSVTINPYMGIDSVSPFLSYTDKWAILLGLTSNQGAADFQLLDVVSNGNIRKLYLEAIEKSASWGNSSNMMYVLGATRAEMLKDIRKMLPEHFFLIPGVGAQGGSLEDVLENAVTDFGGLLINASRSIIFASSERDFAEKAREECNNMQKIMSNYL